MSELVTSIRNLEKRTAIIKDISYENFPVGSWLLPRGLRPHVKCFYQFARTADDIADSVVLSAEEKITTLDQLGEALICENTRNSVSNTAHNMRRSLANTGVTPKHCLDLLAAFRQDAIKVRYRDWSELIGYCTLSAVPVGRYLIDLHGGSRDGYDAADALCKALQIINHLQDCREDYNNLNRVYLPLDWMNLEGASLDMLSAKQTSQQLRSVFARVIIKTNALLLRASLLPCGLKSRRLALESGAILEVAKRLLRLIELHDPLVRRIVLKRPIFLLLCARGAFRGGLARRKLG